MVAIHQVVLLLSAIAGSFAIPLAAPSKPASGSKAYSVPAIHNTNFVRNGTAALLKAYAKYGLKPENKDNILNSYLDKRQDSSVTATPDNNDVEYTCPVTIGAQTLNLDIDTGSADLWVFSSNLPSSDQQGHHVYDPASSPTFQDLSGYSWQIQYADGSGASGSVGTDTVTIGGTTVQRQAVELADQVSSQFVQSANDGLVGLAFSSINTVQPRPQSTFFNNAAQSLNAPLFAAYLPFQTSGAYDFGFLDSSKYAGSVKYTAVDPSKGFWEFPSTSYKVGSKTFFASGRTGIADTGTTLILMSPTAVRTYYSSVPSARLDNSLGGYVFPCSATLPTLSFSVGTAGYATIPSQFLNFGPAYLGSSTTCFGSLQSVGSGTQNIYGDVFFNAYYGVFDASGPRFGFAAAT